MNSQLVHNFWHSWIKLLHTTNCWSRECIFTINIKHDWKAAELHIELLKPKKSAASSKQIYHHCEWRISRIMPYNLLEICRVLIVLRFKKWDDVGWRQNLSWATFDQNHDGCRCLLFYWANIKLDRICKGSETLEEMWFTWWIQLIPLSIKNNIWWHLIKQEYNFDLKPSIVGFLSKSNHNNINKIALTAFRDPC